MDDYGACTFATNGSPELSCEMILYPEKAPVARILFLSKMLKHVMAKNERQALLFLSFSPLIMASFWIVGAVDNKVPSAEGH